MRYIIAAIALVAVVNLFGIGSSSAAPANGQAIAGIAGQSSQVIHVAGGCGRGWHRGPHGHCRRNW
jgi:hypothetical protein